MDIERLKELKDYLRVANELSVLNDDNLMQSIVDSNDVTNTIDIAIKLLNAEIARQSVTSEDVQEAICQMNDALNPQYLESDGEWTSYNEFSTNAIRTAITALQTYQPWVSVAVEKPESGKHVLLCCGVRTSDKRYVCDGFYAEPKSIIGGYDDGESVCEYDEETDEYYLPEGYYEIVKNWEDYSSITIDDFVTHWKPLSEPPKGE